MMSFSRFASIEVDHVNPREPPKIFGKTLQGAEFLNRSWPKKRSKMYFAEVFILIAYYIIYYIIYIEILTAGSQIFTA